MKDTLRKLRVLGIGVLLFLFLGGPTPGNVGSCNDQSQFADPVEFCIERESWICARRRARGEIDPMMELECVDRLNIMCSGLMWPADCEPPPSKQATAACINQLMDPATLGTLAMDVPQCSIRDFLCAGRTGGGI